MDAETRTVELSKIFDWYRRDFSPLDVSDEAVMRWAARFVQGKEGEALQKLLDSQGGVRVVFREYDWSANKL